jgi:hypothetical protein
MTILSELIESHISGFKSQIVVYKSTISNEWIECDVSDLELKNVVCKSSKEEYATWNKVPDL